MFGYVIADGERMTEAEKNTYRACYCGLCRSLKKRCGAFGTLALSYDLVFPALLLMSLYGQTPDTRSVRCLPHPVKKHDCFTHEIIDYCADMNIALMYYKFMDDWEDDRNLLKKAEAGLIRKHVEGVKKRYPRPCGVIEKCLKDLNDMEKADVLSPDRTAACFGALMGEIFVWKQDEKAPMLWEMGNRLGQFVYLCDAALDLSDDIKKKRYNPLISTPTPADGFRATLEMLMGSAAACYEQLGGTQYKQILDNIIYSGVWTRWNLKHGEKKGKHEKRGKSGQDVKVKGPKSGADPKHPGEAEEAEEKREERERNEENNKKGAMP